MSRYFDRTRNAQNLSLAGTSPVESDPERWVEDLRKVNVVGTQIAESRFAHSRKAVICAPPGTPTLSDPALAHGNAMEAYRMLRTRIMRAQTAQGLRSLIFGSAVSEEGKTLTAFNLAHVYSGLKDQRVLLVDGDLRQAGLSRYFSADAGPGLAEALAGEANFDDVVMATNKPNLFFVPAGKHSAPPPELYASQRWKEFLGRCSECFKVILIDAPPIFPMSDFDLMSAACDGILLVVRAQRTHRDLLQKLAGQVDSKKLLGVVYNGTQNESRQSKYNSPYLSNDSHL